MKSLSQLYLSYIHSYDNYANIVWTSTSQTRLKNTGQAETCSEI